MPATPTPLTVLVLQYVPLWVLSSLPGVPNQGAHDIQVCDVMNIVLVELGLVSVTGEARSLQQQSIKYH